MNKKTNFEDVQVDDLMAIVTFVKVDSVLLKTRAGDGAYKKLKVSNVDNGMEFEVQGRELVEQMYSADRFLETKEVTKTELAEKLVSSYNVPFTVVFEKQDKTKRALRGRLLSAEPLLGRSNVEDLDITKGTPLRLVDHRTLESLTVSGIRYVLKK